MMEENLSFNVIFFIKKTNKKHHYLTVLNLAFNYQLKKFICNLNDVPRYMFPKYKSLLSFINKCLFVLFNTTFNNISVISWRSVLSWRKPEDPEKTNHRPLASHWQTLSHNVVHLALIEIRTHNISGDRHWLHRQL
jgi:hypothetical protein